MKKLIRLFLPVVAVLVLAMSLSGCAVGLTCLSHIDRDSNGKCDNCGFEMPISNVENLTIKTEPTKTYYAFNETIDPAGGVLFVEYKDDTPDEEVPFTDERVTIEAPNMSSAGKKMVRVTFDNASVNYVIEVGSQRFTITLDANYPDAPALEPVLATVGSHAEAPADPVREGWSFNGWYTDAECTQSFDFALTTIQSDMTLYAGWTQSYKVTYDANYEGGTDQVLDSVNGHVDSSVRPADREGYVFIGWYTDADCTIPVDYSTALTGNVTVYAGWADASAGLLTVTFDLNYEGAPAATTASVVSGGTVQQPARPTRANVTTKGHQASGFTFGGWYTDSACTTAFDFSSSVSTDMTLYAKWTGEFIFEAEHVSLTVDGQPGSDPLRGMGASGGADGPDMVEGVPLDHPGINSSNGYHVSYLFAPGLAIYFNIQSDRAVSDAKIVLRISAENVGYAITSTDVGGTTDSGLPYSTYMISLNGTAIDYGTIEVDGGWPEFEDYTLTLNASLVEGLNTITLLTANNNGMGGTMSGTAPLVDCIKITTSADLSWTPVTDNEFGQ